MFQKKNLIFFNGYELYIYRKENIKYNLCPSRINRCVWFFQKKKKNPSFENRCNLSSGRTSLDLRYARAFYSPSHYRKFKKKLRFRPKASGRVAYTRLRRSRTHSTGVLSIFSPEATPLMCVCVGGYFFIP